MVFSPNYLFYWMLDKFDKNKNKLFMELASEDHPNGQKAIVKFFDFGGSRSAKSFDVIHLLVKFADSFRKKPLKINIYREELVTCRDITLADFKLCFQLMGLNRDKDYTLTGDGNSGRPEIMLWGTSFKFIGYPDMGKEAGFCDIAYINEVLETTQRKDAYDSIKKRCSMMLICDGNPKYTEHWAFDQTHEYNAFYSQTCYLDNFHLPDGLAAERESKCPWNFEDSHIEIADPLPYMEPGWNGTFFNGFRRRVWDKPEVPDGVIIEDYSLYRRENEQNKKNGTIDKFDYLVYTEGIRCAQTGTVFTNVHWVNSFPDTGFDEVILSMDFGFTKDPTTLVRTGRIGKKDAYIDNHVYQPTATPEICFYVIYDPLMKEVERRRKEGVTDYNELWIACESQDKYGTESFVDGLNTIANAKGLNWNFFKVNKKSIIAGVSLMKKFNLHLVDTPEMKKEQQNYLHRKINGVFVNEPDPESKFCHIWDGARYGFIHFFYWI